MYRHFNKLEGLGPTLIYVIQIPARMIPKLYVLQTACLHPSIISGNLSVSFPAHYVGHHLKSACWNDSTNHVYSLYEPVKLVEFGFVQQVLVCKVFCDLPILFCTKKYLLPAYKIIVWDVFFLEVQKLGSAPVCIE